MSFIWFWLLLKERERKSRKKEKITQADLDFAKEGGFLIFFSFSFIGAIMWIPLFSNWNWYLFVLSLMPVFMGFMLAMPCWLFYLDNKKTLQKE